MKTGNKSAYEAFLNRLKSDRKLLIRVIVLVLVCVFAVMFIFNLLKFNIKSAIDKKTMEANIQTVSELQQAEIKTVEKAVKTIQDKRFSGSNAGKIAKFRRKFAGSVILGDSLTEGLVVYGWLTEQIVMADVGGSIVYSDDNFKKAAKTLPDNAFFAYGMNDMGNYAGDAGAFVKKYKKLIHKFQKTSPDTRIFICSITTPTKEARAGNKSIRAYKKFNKALKKMCEDEGIVFIDVTDILPAHPGLYAGDGIHAAPDYYPLWMNRVCEKADL